LFSHFKLNIKIIEPKRRRLRARVKKMRQKKIKEKQRREKQKKHTKRRKHDRHVKDDEVERFVITSGKDEKLKTYTQY
jgi:hypothetical protein